MKERWKPVDNWPHYQVSNLGHIRSPNGVMNPGVDYRGYRVVQLRPCIKKVRTVKVALLVLTAFKGERPEQCEIDHKNRIRNDDRISNLKWVTRLENVINRGRFTGSSSGGIPGVSWYKKLGKWRGHKRIDGKLRHVGYFDTIKETAIAVRNFK